MLFTIHVFISLKWGQWVQTLSTLSGARNLFLISPQLDIVVAVKAPALEMSGKPSVRKSELSVGSWNSAESIGILFYESPCRSVTMLDTVPGWLLQWVVIVCTAHTQSSQICLLTCWCVLPIVSFEEIVYSIEHRA